MLEAFETKYGDPGRSDLPIADGPDQLRDRAGDRVFGGGLYRVLSQARADEIAPELYRAYLDYNEAVDCFATDWMGNVFAVHARTEQVMLFELATCEALGLGVPFDQFHTDLLVNDADAALAEPLFAKWRASGGDLPGPA